MDVSLHQKAKEIQELQIERKILIKKFLNDDFDSRDQIVESLVLNGFRLIILDSTIRYISVFELEQKKTEREQRAVARQRARERFRQKMCKESFFNLLLLASFF